MPKRKRPEESPKEQFKRFIEAAEQIGVTEELVDVEKRFKALAEKPKKTPRQGAE